MKRGTPRHKKMHALAGALGVPLYGAVGIMEMLWHYTGMHTPEGDIGSVSDAEIANAVGWEKKPDRLINALVQSNWVERHESYRLIIHDWPDHCEQSVKKWLDRNRKKVLPVYGQLADAVRTDDGQMPDGVRASRGQGKAGQGSVVSSEEKKDAKEPPVICRVTIPKFGPDFEAVIGAFLAAGVKLSDPQILEAAREWSLIPIEEQSAVAECAQARALCNDAKWMGLPHTWLRKAEWRARGPGRLLPEARAQTKAEIGQNEAARRFMEGRADG